MSRGLESKLPTLLGTGSVMRNTVCRKWGHQIGHTCMGDCPRFRETMSWSGRDAVLGDWTLWTMGVAFGAVDKEVLL
eukprot:gene18078-biopygen615